MFSKNYFKYLLKSNKALILVVILISALNVLMTSSDMGQGFSFSISISLCYVLPILIFKFVHDNKAVDTYYALPIKKESLLFTGLLFCFVLVILPYFGSNIIIALINDGTIVKELVLHILVNCLSFIALMIFNLYFYLIANNNVDGIIVLAAYTTLPLVLYLFVSMFCEIFICGYSYVEASIFEYLSPFANSIVLYIDIEGIRVLITCLYIALFSILLVKSFINRKVERAGKTSNNVLAYPTLINLYVLLIVSAISFNYGNETNLWSFLSESLILYLMIFILYVAFSFVYKRKFYIDVKMPIYFITIIVISLLCSKIIYKNEAFGLSNIHPQYNKNTMYQLTLYDYNNDESEVKKWVEDKIQNKTEYFEIAVEACDLNGLDEKIIAIFEDYRKQAIEQFYQEVDKQESILNLYVYPNYEDFNNIFRNYYSYSVLNKKLSIDELIALAKYDGVTVKFETDLKEYQLNKNGELVYIKYDEETVGIEY